MADDERLVVLLEARISEFEKRMAQAERRGTRTYTKLRQDSSSATKAMEADMRRSATSINAALANVSSTIGAFGKGFLGGVAGGVAAFGLQGVVRAARDAAREFAEIGNAADRAGLSVRAFQELRFIGEQNRIGVDEMVDGLKELSLRADEFIQTGAGPAAEAFQRLGYDAADLKRKLVEPEKLFAEIIGRLGELDRAAQIRIADEVFGGTAGERFVELIDQGEEGLRRTTERAHDLGVVIDEDLVQKAADLDAMFNSVATTVGTALKSAIVSAAASLVDFLRLWRDFDQQRTQSLESQVNDVIRERAKLVEEKTALESNDGLSENAINLGFGADSKVNQQRIADLQAQIDDLTATEDEIIGVLRQRNAPAPMPTAPDGTPWVPPTPPEGGFGSSGKGRSGGGGGRKSSASDRADDLEREIEAIERRTAAVVAGTAAQEAINPTLNEFGYAAARAAAMSELLVAAQQAGVEVTPELRAQIEGLAEAYGKAEAAQNQLNDAQDGALNRAEDWADLRADTTQGLVQDLLNGVDAADAFASALGRVGDQLISMVLNDLFSSGGGGGGNILGAIGSAIGGLFGGFKAAGGPVSGGKSYIVGEHGPELFRPAGSGSIVPNHQLQGGGQSVVVNYSPTINAQGSDSSVLPTVKAMLDQQKQEFDTMFNARAINAVRDPEEALMAVFDLVDFMGQVRVANVTWHLQTFTETSGTGSGHHLTAEIAPAKWAADVTLTPMTIPEARKVRAIMRQIGPHQSFLIFDPTAPYPLHDPTGSILGGRSVTVAGVTGTTLRLQGLAPNYRLTWGDKVAVTYGSSPVRRALFEVADEVLADGAGTTPVFRINPPMKTGIAAGAAANLLKPAAQMVFLNYDPGSTEGVIASGPTFRAMEAIR